MNETTIKTIGWTTFGVVFCIMFYGTFISMSLANADIKISINMDNNTKDSINNMSYLQNKIAELEYKRFLIENNISVYRYNLTNKDYGEVSLENIVESPPKKD